MKPLLLAFAAILALLVLLRRREPDRATAVCWHDDSDDAIEPLDPEMARRVRLVEEARGRLYPPRSAA